MATRSLNNRPPYQQQAGIVRMKVCRTSTKVPVSGIKVSKGGPSSSSPSKTSSSSISTPSTKTVKKKATPSTHPNTTHQKQSSRPKSSKSKLPETPTTKPGSPARPGTGGKAARVRGIERCDGEEGPKQAAAETSCPLYSPGKQLIHRPVEPFKVFMDEGNVLAKIVWLYLLESQLPFTKVSIQSKESEKIAGSVPSFCKDCLFTDGKSTLGQPSAIIRYLCVNYTNNLLMGLNNGHVSQAFSWLHWSISVLHRDLFHMSEGELQKPPEEMVQSELVKNSLDSVSLYFDMLNKIFETRDFLLGREAWFCDSALALVLENAKTLNLESWPHLTSWLARVHSQPNWATVTLPADS